jgi:hypothetical protein
MDADDVLLEEDEGLVEATLLGPFRITIARSCP